MKNYNHIPKDNSLQINSSIDISNSNIQNSKQNIERLNNEIKAQILILRLYFLF